MQKIGNRHQMMVNGEPFLMMAGELGNSTASTMESMKMVWSRLKGLHLNTLIVPVYWELLEPNEGEFDVKLVDDLILEARKHSFKLVFLWFGSWKNSMSCYSPAWVKTDLERFPRAQSEEGISQEILSPFSKNNLQADLQAYVYLLRHLKEFDEDHQTVILVQIENEIGMLPSARDHSPLANIQFESEVPKAFIDYLVSHKEKLNPGFYEMWERNGLKSKGNWETVFGEGLHTDELFMAWHFARYVDELASAGKKEYALPVFVNAALNHPGKKPGEYPSAGPLPHVMDVWMAASPNIDFYSPDFYNPDFKLWCDLYVRQGNPLFIPEHKFDHTVAAKALYAFGHYEALGFSPFAIEQNPEAPFSNKEIKLSRVYEILHQVKPLLAEYRGQQKADAVLLDKEANKATFTLGKYEFTAGHTHNFGWEPNAEAEEWEQASAIVIQTGENDFWYVGFGVSLTFRNIKDENARVGILKAERGYFRDGKWIIHQHLNGDQTHQGRHIRSFVDDVSIQRFTLYEYK
ncbi:MAG: DUF5597 domain-containing protein [Bacteroidales bacterium]|nr:DUF5597 domain-containing protein [Bacteroidales bacterium]